MRGARLLAWARSQCWALRPQEFTVMAAVFERWARGEIASPSTFDQVGADAADRRSRRTTNASVGAGVIVLPLHGILSQRGNMADDISGPGSTSTQIFSQSIRDAIADETVSAILIDCDSPGGSVFGVQELADEVFAARQKKPVIAFSNSLCASAALWVASQATEFYSTVGGEIGSIGVVMQHQDWSAYNAEKGISVTYLTAPMGGHKAEGNPDEPLTDETKTYEQGRLEEYYDAFVSSVARGRGVNTAKVRSAAWGLGRTLGAKAAADVGMIDGIRSFDAVIARARQLAKTRPPSAAKHSARSASPARAQREHLERRIRISEQR